MKTEEHSEATAVFLHKLTDYPDALVVGRKNLTFISRGIARS